MSSWRQYAKAVAARNYVLMGDVEADYVLWNETCFPFGTLPEVMRQVREYVEERA